MTPQNIRNAVDSWLAARWPTIQARQAAYAAANGGNYWQGLKTHIVNLPLDNTDTAADGLTQRARGSLPRWTDVWPAMPTNLPCRLEMHEYASPAGKGYMLVVTIRITGLGTWQRTLSFGPEDHSKPWTRMVRS